MLHKFKNEELLRTAFTHQSVKDAKNYQVFEFIGDKIISAVLAGLLFEKFPNFSEAELSIAHSNLANSATMSKIARKINLGSFLILDKWEEAAGGREKTKLLEDALEAYIGAIYLDSDFYTAKNIIESLWKDEISDKIKMKDPKSRLQEWTQKLKHNIPVYTITKKTGEDHSPLFTIEVKAGNFKAQAQGFSKKEAESLAAENLLNMIENKNE